MLYERTALSRKPEELARQELVTLRSQGEVDSALLFKILLFGGCVYAERNSPCCQ